MVKSVHQPAAVNFDSPEVCLLHVCGPYHPGVCFAEIPPERNRPEYRLVDPCCPLEGTRSHWGQETTGIHRACCGENNSSNHPNILATSGESRLADDGAYLAGDLPATAATGKGGDEQGYARLVRDIPAFRKSCKGLASMQLISETRPAAPSLSVRDGPFRTLPTKIPPSYPCTRKERLVSEISW